MKVIKSYSDYYDGALSYFMSEVYPVYIREEQSIDKKDLGKLKLPRLFKYSCSLFKEDLDKYRKRYSSNGSAIADLIVIGFCGKIYPMFIVEGSDIDSKYFFSTSEKLKSSFENIEDKYNLEIRYEIIYQSLQANSNLLDLFLKYKVPSFMYSGNELILNPVLKNFGLQTVLHPFNAVQELNMFLSNQLCDTSNPVMPVGDDVTLARSKGYDKYSFRKAPSKKNTKKKIIIK